MQLFKFFRLNRSAGQAAPVSSGQRQSFAGSWSPLHSAGKSRDFNDAAQEINAIIRNYEATAKAMADTGISDGTHGIPEADSSGSYAESEIENGHDTAWQEVRLSIATTRTHLEKTQQQVNATIQDDAIEQQQKDRSQMVKRAALDAVHREAQGLGFDRKLRRLLRQTGSVEGVITTLREQLRQLEEKQRHVDGRFQQLLLRVYANMPPAKRWIDRRYAFTVVVVLLCSFEFFANFTAFQAIDFGGNNTGSLLVGFFATAMQAYCAKEFGKALRDRNSKQIWIFAIATAVLCLFVCIPRLIEGTIMLKTFYVLLNLTIAGITVYLGNLYAKHYKFFAAQRERDMLATAISRLAPRIKQIESDYRNRLEEVEERCRMETEQGIRDGKKNLQVQSDRIESELVELEKLESKSQGLLDRIRSASLERYRYDNSRARKDKGHAPVKRWQDDSDEGADDLSMIKKISVILLFIGFGLASCGEQAPATYMEVLYDSTDGIHAQVNTAPMRDYIMNYVNEDIQDGAWGKFEVTLSQIGETSTQFTRTVTLAASEPYWLRNENETRQRPERFKQELGAALDSLTQPMPKTDHSYIHRNFYYRLQELAPKQGRKIVLSWSDLILNDPPVNFYHYEKNPHKILEQKDALIKRMTKDYPLDTLPGIELTNFYQPDRDMDALHEAAKKYFRYYWQQLGMKVEFKSALPVEMTVLKEQTQ